MESNATQAVRALLILAVGVVAMGAIVARVANGPGAETVPAPSAVATTSVQGPTGAVTEVPDCEYRLPPCARYQDGQWFLINDYQGDRHPVTLIGTVVRGSIVYRMIREG